MAGPGFTFSARRSCATAWPPGDCTRPAGAKRKPSVGIAIHEPVPDCQEEDAQIEPRRPVRDVVQIVLDALAERCVAAPAIDLGPAGDARFHRVPGVVAGDRLDELADE